MPAVWLLPLLRGAGFERIQRRARFFECSDRQGPLQALAQFFGLILFRAFLRLRTVPSRRRVCDGARQRRSLEQIDRIGFRGDASTNEFEKNLSETKNAVEKDGVLKWSLPGSNRRPSACKADALPIELRPRTSSRSGRERRGYSIGKSTGVKRFYSMARNFGDTSIFAPSHLPLSPTSLSGLPLSCSSHFLNAADST